MTISLIIVMLVTLYYYSESNILNLLRKLNAHQNYMSNILVPNTSTDLSAIDTAGKLIKFVTNFLQNRWYF